jgi:hypothetical protein
MMTYQCHNPACRRPVRHADAFLRSVLLERVAFCSAACIALFSELDAASGRQPIPEQQSEPSEKMSA